VSWLADRIGRFRELDVLVVGDVVLDENVWGTCRRVSPEAPVPIVDVERLDVALGAAGNAAANAIALGARHTTLVATIGDDTAGRAVLAACGVAGIDSRLFVDEEAVTIRKCRVYADGRQVARYDIERPRRSPAVQQRLLLDRALGALETANAVIVSDYCKGAWTDEGFRVLLSAANDQGVVVVVDTKRTSPEVFRGCTALTPTLLEFREWERTLCADLPCTMECPSSLIDHLLAARYARALLVTGGRHGMTLYDRTGSLHLAARSSSVVNPIGAGDTAAAAFALGLAVGLSPRTAATVANAAAGIVVQLPGTVPASVSDLLGALGGFDNSEWSVSESSGADWPATSSANLRAAGGT
jgi:D-beta-D-heptose 7-phosphate kinase/D-beta-D-heptose 1-phosphate adenosyltransferase